METIPHMGITPKLLTKAQRQAIVAKVRATGLTGMEAANYAMYLAEEAALIEAMK